MAIDSTISDQQTPYSTEEKGFTPEWLIEQSRLDEASATDDIKKAIEILYPSEVMYRHASELLEEVDFIDKANGRTWAVLALDGKDPRSDIAKRVELERFCTYFGTHPVKHYNDYGPYDESSLFVTVIDAKNPDTPKPASELRIVRNGEKGLKTINTLLSKSPEDNPWSEEIAEMVAKSEDNKTPKEIIEAAMGVDPETTWAIESMAALDTYAGKHGGFGEATFPLYAVCLQLSDMAGIKTWISIQDLRPMQQMQDMFSNPWEWLDVPPRTFEGPYPTLPAFIRDMSVAEARLRVTNPAMGELLIDGKGLSDSYVMAEELHGSKYLGQLISRAV